MTEPVVIALSLSVVRNPHLIGYIPTFLDLDDPRPAAEQFQERYVYGGWKAQEGFTKSERPFVLKFPGDPPLTPIAAMPFRDEMVMIYGYGYVAIWQKDGSFEACRLD